MAAAAALLLAGCGVGQVGAAAVVGQQAISTSEVDAVASALCSAQSGNGTSTSKLPSRGARQGALQALLAAEVARQFGHSLGLHANQAKVAESLANDRLGIQSLPADEQDAFRQALKVYAEGRLMLAQVGRKALEAQGQKKISQKQAIAAGVQKEGDFAKKLDVEVDPRFGQFHNGTLVARSGSLSVPVSSTAHSGAKAQPSAEWVSSLPRSQLCG
ncbi:MAG TPA: SurA N-terminal domain-containing protein [Nocardioidaceae bacterium]|nr:SurA N-terminal domain-containing protein [Nocardioidaceae bacterium]